MNNCVIYARFSSRGQNEQSIESQVRTCKEFAEDKGFNVVGIYADKAKTGTNDKRPDFQRMMKDAASGAFQYILVYMLDRFSRNRRDSIIYKEMLKDRYGVKIISALEPIAEDEGGEFYEMFLEWNAEKYSKRLSKRVRDGIDTSVANGLFCGGIIIYGYKVVLDPIDGKVGKFVRRVAIEEDEARIVKCIFEEYDKGVSKKEIADALNKQGERYKGKPFDFKSFDKMLVNAKYTGDFIYGGRQCNNTYPPIIDKALFDRVQKRLAKNKHVAGGVATAKVPYLLTGKLFCGHCGTEMIADNGTSKSGAQYCYYACKKKRKGECTKHRENKDGLELYVTECVIDFLSDPNNVEIMVSDVLNYYDKRTDESNIKSIAAKIANIKSEVGKLTDAFINAQSVLLRNTIEQKMSEYEIMLNDLQTQQAQLELERGYKLTKKDLTDFIQVLLQGDKTDKAYQKKVIDNLVKQVYVSDGDTVVYFNIRGGTDIELPNMDLETTNKVKNKLLGVREQQPLPCQTTCPHGRDFVLQGSATQYRVEATYKSSIPACLHCFNVCSLHTEAWTSPICALSSMSIQSRD